MAQMTIYPSGSTWIQNGSSADRSSAAQLYTSYLGYKKIGETITGLGASGHVAAVLQFSRPSILKYARITSVRLWFELNGYDYEHYGNGEYYAVSSYATENTPSQISWTGLLQNGILGDWIEGGNHNYYETPYNCVVNVTAAYSAALSNEKLTFVIAAGTYSYGTNLYGWINPTNCKLVVEYEPGTQPAPTPLYPRDITLIEPEQTLFSWQFNAETGAVQTAAELQWKNVTDENYTTVSLTQSGYSYTLNAELPVGSYQWRVKVTNDAGETSSYSDVAYFSVIGKPAAPIINDIENKTLPTITWNTTDQQSCEIILSDQSGKELYHDTLATNESIFRPNFFLDGGYLFSVRVMNNSMMWSDWAQRGFNINASGPSAATLSLVTVAGDLAVNLSYTLPEGVGAVLMRSQGSGEKVLAELDPLESTYRDDTVAANLSYSYWIRTYDEGFTDTAHVIASVAFEGAILNGESASLNLNVSDEKFLPHSEDITREYALLSLSGREYPMIERGDFTKVEFSRRFHVTAAQKKILDILSKQESLFYRDSKENAFRAAITHVHYDEYMDNGYIGTLDIVRLNDEEDMLNV